jgi:hypothetical protein
LIRRAAPLLLAVLVLSAAGADAQQRFDLATGTLGRGVGLMGSADPSAIVAAEIAFAQLARKEGQWTGFRKTADKDAVMFVPGVVNAQAWLRKQKDPPKSVTWAPDRIVIACDGSYAISTGHAEWPDGHKGRFVTLWRQQADGGYKWVLDWGSNAAPPQDAEADAIDGKVADCPARRGPGGGPAATGETPAQSDLREWTEGSRRKRPKPPQYEVTRIPDPPPASGEGQSHDSSLHWQWTTDAAGARALKVTARYDGKIETVIDDKFVAAR